MTKKPKGPKRGKKLEKCKACGMSVHIICTESDMYKKLQALKSSHKMLLCLLKIEHTGFWKRKDCDICEAIKRAETLGANDSPKAKPLQETK